MKYLLLWSLMFFIHSTAIHGKSKEFRLTIAQKSGGFSLDPAKTFGLTEFYVKIQIYNALVRIDEDAKLVPSLATKWKRINDSTIRFYLRKDVKFHNGDKLTSKDVKFSLERLIDPKTKYPAQFLISSLKRVKIIDNYTFDIITGVNDAIMLEKLGQFGLIIPKKYFNKVGPKVFGEKPVGTGPFIFHVWQNKNKKNPSKPELLILKKFTNYFEKGVSKVDRMVFKYIDNNKQLDALFKGEIDFLDVMNPRRTLKCAKSKKTKLYKIQNGFVTSGFHFNLNGPLKDKRVRKAINLGIDNEAIRKYVYKGNMNILATWTVPGELGHNPNLKPHKYNPKEARKLLKEAGYEKGLSIRMWCEPTEPIPDLCNTVKKQLEVIGIKTAKLDLAKDRLDWNMKMVLPKIDPKKYSFDYDMMGASGGTAVFGIGTFIPYILLHSKGPLSAMNEKKYDDIYNKAMSTIDKKEFQNKLWELDKLMHEEFYGHYGISPVATFCASNKVKGLKMHKTRAMQFRGVYLDD